MTSQDDLTLLKQMYQRGEITDEQYDALRRHVLWGTPLPQLLDETAAAPPAEAESPPAYPPAPPPSPPARSAGYPAGDPRSGPPPVAYGREGSGPWDEYGREGSGPRDGYGAAPGSRQARREAAGDYAPSTYLPPTGAPRPLPDPDPPPAAPERGFGGPPAWGGPDRSFGEAPGRRGGEESVSYRPPTDRSGARAAREVDPDGSRRGRRRDEAEPRRAAADPARTGRRRPRRRSLVAVLTSMVLALALAAAGVYWFVLRETGVRPAEYARAVCGSVRDWQQGVDSGSAALVTRIAREEDRGAVRSAVGTYYTDLAGRTDQLRTAVLAAGVADVSGGRAYADSLAAAVGDQATALRELSARAGRLDPAAAATFQIQLQSLLTGSETAVGSVSAALARPSAGTPAQLRTALGAEPACAPYVG